MPSHHLHQHIPKTQASSQAPSPLWQHIMLAHSRHSATSTHSIHTQRGCQVVSKPVVYCLATDGSTFSAACTADCHASGLRCCHCGAAPRLPSFHLPLRLCHCHLHQPPHHCWLGRLCQQVLAAAEARLTHTPAMTRAQSQLYGPQARLQHPRRL